MTFFNKKSEVISIELTSYGKYLLSKGKFKPVYYDFIDNDILYDSLYGGISENRNNISQRINNETPRIKPQYIFTGVETKLKELLKIKNQLQKQRNKAVKDEELIENAQIFEKLYFNSSPLGNSSLDDKFPALNFYTYNVEILNSKLYKNNNSHIINVPEITLKDINYSSSILLSQNEDSNRVLNIEENQFSLDTQLSPQQGAFIETTGVKIFSDGTFFSTEEKSALFQFFEENVINDSENFEIEFYTFETGSKGEEIIKQLYFNKSTENFIDDQTKVEYFFELNVDGNISQNQLELIKNKKQTTVIQPSSTGKQVNIKNNL